MLGYMPFFCYLLLVTNFPSVDMCVVGQSSQSTLFNIISHVFIEKKVSTQLGKLVCSCSICAIDNEAKRL